MTNTRVVRGSGFRICFDDEQGFLRAYVFDGTDSLEVSLAMWRMLAAECQVVGATRMLVLEDLVSTVEIADIEAVVDSVQRTGLGSVKIAFVELRDDIQGSELAEIYCRERGMDARMFSMEDEARRWLLYSE